MVKPLADLGGLGMAVVECAGVSGGQHPHDAKNQWLGRDDQEGPKNIVCGEEPPFTRRIGVPEKDRKRQNGK